MVNKKILIFAVMIFSVLVFSGFVSSTTYQISTCQQLQDMQNDLAGDYVLTGNIDCSATNTWNFNSAPGYGYTEGFNPVGTYGNYFTGSLNGNGFEITGLYIKRPDKNYVGLFGANRGTINNIGLINVDITGDALVGGLVGWGYSGITISNSHSAGSIKGSSNAVGGLAGTISSTGSISNSYSSGNVEGLNNVGGLVGNTERGSSISNSYSTANVGGKEKVGGLVGNNGGQITNNGLTSTIINSHSSGDLSIDAGGKYAGGLVGFNNLHGSISQSYTSSDVNYGLDSIGGFVGENQGTIINSYTFLNSVDGDSNIGGFVGKNYDTGIISNSYASTSVFGGGSSGGGFAGSNAGNCNANNFYDRSISVITTSPCGSGKTTAEMKTQSTFTSWDFASIWSINAGTSYPYFYGKCSDGIKNQDETGVDCGGQCSGCLISCGNGQCSGGERCGTTNTFPECNFDCGACLPQPCIDFDSDKYNRTQLECGTNFDCNDANNKIFPNAPESCDGVDNQCPQSQASVDENNGDCSSGELCVSGKCLKAYWGNPNTGQEIIIVNAKAGDKISLVLSNPPIGTSSWKFNIYEKDSTTSDDNIRTGVKALTGTLSGNKIIAEWTITQTDITTATDSGEPYPYNFYFNVTGVSATCEGGATYFCSGQSRPCQSYSSSSSCNSRPGCSWSGVWFLGSCNGPMVPCSDFIDEISTQCTQSGCDSYLNCLDIKDNNLCTQATGCALSSATSLEYTSQILQLEWPTQPTIDCGDNNLDSGETCDDGNTINGDGCSATCTIESGYSCSGTPSICTGTGEPFDCSQYTLCSDYTESDCNADACQVSILYGCSWSGTSCNPYENLVDQTTGEVIGTCVYTEDTTDTCDNDGILEYSLELVDGSSVDCESKNPVSIMCSSKTKLPLENKFGILLTIISIIGIYFLFFRKNKILKKEKK